MDILLIYLFLVVTLLSDGGTLKMRSSSDVINESLETNRAVRKRDGQVIRTEANGQWTSFRTGWAEQKRNLEERSLDGHHSVELQKEIYRRRSS